MSVNNSKQLNSSYASTAAKARYERFLKYREGNHAQDFRTLNIFGNGYGCQNCSTPDYTKASNLNAFSNLLGNIMKINADRKAANPETNGKGTGADTTKDVLSNMRKLESSDDLKALQSAKDQGDAQSKQLDGQITEQQGIADQAATEETNAKDCAQKAQTGIEDDKSALSDIKNQTEANENDFKKGTEEIDSQVQAGTLTSEEGASKKEELKNKYETKKSELEKAKAEKEKSLNKNNEDLKRYSELAKTSHDKAEKAKNQVKTLTDNKTKLDEESQKLQQQIERVQNVKGKSSGLKYTA